MIVLTDTGAIRLPAPSPETPDLTADECAWISLLRDLGGGSTPPPSLAVVQAVRRTMNAT